MPKLYVFLCRYGSPDYHNYCDSKQPKENSLLFEKSNKGYFKYIYYNYHDYSCSDILRIYEEEFSADIFNLPSWIRAVDSIMLLTINSNQPSKNAASKLHPDLIRMLSNFL